MIDGQPPTQEVTRALTTACAAMRDADNPTALLLAFDRGVEGLSLIGGDDATIAIDRLRDLAIELGVDHDDVEESIERGKQRAVLNRPLAAGRGRRYPFARFDPIDHANGDTADVEDDEELRDWNREHR